MRSDHVSTAPAMRRLRFRITSAISIAATAATLIVAATMLIWRSPEPRQAVTVAAAAETTTTLSQRPLAAGPATTTTQGPPPSTTSTTSTTALAARGSFCDLLRSYTEQVRRISISLTDPETVRPLLDEALPAIAESARVAAPAAAGDVSTLRDTLTQLRAALEGSAYRFADLPAGTVAQLASPEFMGSFARLDTLARKGC